MSNGSSQSRMVSKHRGSFSSAKVARKKQEKKSRLQQLAASAAEFAKKALSKKKISGEGQ